MKRHILVIFSILAILGSTSLFYPLVISRECKFIPVSFDKFHLPLIDIELEGKIYPLVVDLGFKAQMDLEDGILQTVNKQSFGTSRSMDLKSNRYISPKYVIPTIKMGGVSFDEVIVKEKNEAFHRNTVIREQNANIPSKRRGTVGFSLLKRKNLLLDFPHARLAFIDKDNRQVGYPVEDMLKVPFEMTASGVIINIGTDMGEKKFLVDTGATMTALRSSECCPEKYHKDSCEQDCFVTSQFVIGGKNFGDMVVYPLDITPEMDKIDGFLGMTFLMDHVVYIDFREKMLYIGDEVRGPE